MGDGVVWKGVPTMRLPFVAGLTQMRRLALDATRTRTNNAEEQLIADY